MVKTKLKPFPWRWHRLLRWLFPSQALNLLVIDGKAYKISKFDKGRVEVTLDRPLED